MADDLVPGVIETCGFGIHDDSELFARNCVAGCHACPRQEVAQDAILPARLQGMGCRLEVGSIKPEGTLLSLRLYPDIRGDGRLDRRRRLVQSKKQIGLSLHLFPFLRQSWCRDFDECGHRKPQWVATMLRAD